ncbi:hypothetical protein CONPUDRAFT_81278 [Coniophora puteana RWD-64-598 SS2]|uniref:Pentatricopeptide repeat-containing protein-mitochondrial domain-containing protein n=1 Tax=Coniophora puteana (strain RWD-64-598) TaxID=741705 RepID=A0A5M3MVV8_CONPW|nr:uncharacterized protein CONPUDRAFT_81278 [Coniophora puteana RWD-64-598 SS2]EIW83273.1 hypothetical protein CONPUDRAFT_81278 [Coniophora puteana RWD-64-598 SS2]
MKADDVKPDLDFYNTLLSGLAYEARTVEANAVVDDMQAMGIEPDRITYHHLIEAHRYRPSKFAWDLIERMEAADIKANEQTFSLLIKRFTDNENLEMALQQMQLLLSQKKSPDLSNVQDIIVLASKLGHPKLALDLAREFEKGSIRRLDTQTWMNVLMASADSFFAEGVTQCWNKLVGELSILPDEGLCLSVLHTAGRHGLPDLAADALRVLRALDVSWEEHHFAPVIEAFCRVGKMKEAFGTLSVLRANGVTPVSDTVHPIFEALRADVDRIDDSWTTLDALRTEGKDIDTAALNALVQACVALGDLQRAIGAYQAFGEYGAAPDIETFNALLAGCVSAQHRALGDRLLGELKAAGITPDARTYERIVLLCLTQPQYEDAFFYLEEMKAQKFMPPLSVYDTLIRTCYNAGDTRWQLAFAEMKECGHPVTDGLAKFIRSSVISRGRKAGASAPESAVENSESDAASGQSAAPAPPS